MLFPYKYRDMKLIPGNGASPHTGCNVYTAIDTMEDCLVCIKTCTGKVKNTSRTLKYEYDLLKDLNHINIVKAYDYGYTKETDTEYLVMEYGTLGRRCKWRKYVNKQYEFHLDPKNGSPDIIWKHFVKQILDGLVYLWRNDIFHNDTEFANLVLSENKNYVLIIDFGRTERKKYDLFDDVLINFQDNPLPANAFLRELTGCGPSKTYIEEGPMVDISVEEMNNLILEFKKNLILCRLDKI